MTVESPEQWLAGEVTDLLDAGSVGLYELIWLLNGSDFQLVTAEKKEIAYAVAKSILSSGKAQLYELVWPSGKALDGPVDLAVKVSSADVWPVEASDRYLALQ